jgi:hypothetical protein
MSRFNTFYLGELADVLNLVEGDVAPPNEAERAVLIINVTRRLARLEKLIVLREEAERIRDARPEVQR